MDILVISDNDPYEDDHEEGMRRVSDLADLLNEIETPPKLVPVRFNTSCNAIDGYTAPNRPFYIMLSAKIAEGRLMSAVRDLRDAFPSAEILVDARDDHPEAALDIVVAGAYNIVSAGPVRVDNIIYSVGQMRSGLAPYTPQLVQDGAEGRSGFIAMGYDPTRRARAAFESAVVPVRRYLDLDLKRVDELVQRGSPSITVEFEMKNRDYVLCLTADMNGGVVFEIGLAKGIGKPVILVGPKGVPVGNSMVEGFPCVEYDTYTELAMKLYFGLRT